MDGKEFKKKIWKQKPCSSSLRVLGCSHGMLMALCTCFIQAKNKSSLAFCSSGPKIPTLTLFMNRFTACLIFVAIIATSLYLVWAWPPVSSRGFISKAWNQGWEEAQMLNSHSKQLNLLKHLCSFLFPIGGNEGWPQRETAEISKTHTLNHEHTHTYTELLFLVSTSLCYITVCPYIRDILVLF